MHEAGKMIIGRPTDDPNGTLGWCSVHSRQCAHRCGTNGCAEVGAECEGKMRKESLIFTSGTKQTFVQQMELLFTGQALYIDNHVTTTWQPRDNHVTTTWHMPGQRQVVNLIRSSWLSVSWSLHYPTIIRVRSRWARSHLQLIQKVWCPLHGVWNL